MLLVSRATTRAPGRLREKGGLSLSPASKRGRAGVEQNDSRREKDSMAFVASGARVEEEEEEEAARQGGRSARRTRLKVRSTVRAAELTSRQAKKEISAKALRAHLSRRLLF